VKRAKLFKKTCKFGFDALPLPTINPADWHVLNESGKRAKEFSKFSILTQGSR
jgi:hypothetical protein